MINVLSLFSGIGAFERALDNLGIEYNLVNYCEIDKYASKSYSILYDVSEDMNLGDITKIDDLDLLGMPVIDLLSYGFPCTDISLAGYGRGLEYNGQKTRSGLVWDAHHIIDTVRPKVAICENVKNLTSKKFANEFKAILENLEELGYNNYWKVLNAKDFGVPQNRERVFIVSIRKDIDDGSFKFPQGFPLEIRLKDVLDAEVDEKYYIKKALNIVAKEKYVQWDNTGKGHNSEEYRGYYQDGLSPTLPSSIAAGDKSQVVLVDKEDIQGCLFVKTANKQGYDIAQDGDYINTEHPSSTTRRGRVGHQVCQTLDTSATAHCVVVGEPQVNRLGSYTPSGYKGTAIVGVDGLAPSVMENHGQGTAIPVACDNNRVIVAGRINSSQDGIDIDPVGIAPTHTAGHGNMPKVIDQNCVNGDVAKTVRAGGHGSLDRHSWDIGQCPTKLRIRKLTPFECFALMGFEKSDAYKLSEHGISNTQLYKQAGNSICVPCLEYIFKELYK